MAKILIVDDDLETTKLFESIIKTSEHTPIIMVSALSDDGTKRDAINAGANGFIVKPVIPSSFLAQINALHSKL